MPEILWMGTLGVRPDLDPPAAVVSAVAATASSSDRRSVSFTTSDSSWATREKKMFHDKIDQYVQLE